MRYMNVSSSTALQKIYFVLSQDIETLELMTEKKTEKRSIDFITSLIEAKKKIIALLPSTQVEMLSQPSSTPDNTLSVGYKSKDHIAEKSMSGLLSILYDLEEEQRQYVAAAHTDSAISDEHKSIIQEVLHIYGQITEQLKRSQNTRQINPIQL